MKTFPLILQSHQQSRRVENVVSFVGEDRSGVFGILAGHSRMIAALELGLARYQTSDGLWTYVALPGGLLYFVNNALYLSTRRYMCDTDYNKIAAALKQQFSAEEEKLLEIKEGLRRLEEAMLKRLWEAGRESSRLP